MPEINKNYNEQEHIILCANGQKEYCGKKKVKEEITAPCGGKFIGFIKPYDFPLPPNMRCLPFPYNIDTLGVVPVYYTLETIEDIFSPSGFSTRVEIYESCEDTVPVSALSSHPDMVAFTLNNGCGIYNWSEELQKYFFVQI